MLVARVPVPVLVSNVGVTVNLTRLRDVLVAVRPLLVMRKTWVLVCVSVNGAYVAVSDLWDGEDDGVVCWELLEVDVSIEDDADADSELVSLEAADDVWEDDWDWDEDADEVPVEEDVPEVADCVPEEVPDVPEEVAVELPDDVPKVDVEPELVEDVAEVDVDVAEFEVAVLELWCDELTDEVVSDDEVCADVVVGVVVGSVEERLDSDEAVVDVVRTSDDVVEVSAVEVDGTDEV